MAEEHSSDDSDTENHNELHGILHKWTNYIHGWQDRYIVLKSGTLSYYKSAQELGYGCRGALSLAKATIKPHEFDECRFDVSVNDCVWYLRADSVESKQLWVDALESYKAESGYGTGSENSLKRHGSTVSLQSTTFSTASSSSFKRTGRNLREKLAELDTFKDILCGQIDTLQQFFDICAENVNVNDNDIQSDVKFLSNAKVNLPDIDFKGEAITFRTTTAAVLDTLAHCVDLVMQREESWRKRLEKETERRKRTENLSKSYFDQLQKIRNVHPGPDMESSNLIFLISLLILGGILYQLRNLYNNHQRNLRIETYSKDVMKLTEEMNMIHKVANSSLGLLRKLENYVNDDVHKYKHKLS